MSADPARPSIRVLMVLSAIRMGGAERVLIRLLPHLAHEGVDVTVCTVIDEADAALGGELDAAGITRLSLHARRAFDAGSWRRLRRELASGEFDVVHAHDSQSQTVVGFVGPTTRVPVIMTRHVVGEVADRWRSRGRVKAAHLAARVGATEVVAVSDAVGDQVRDAVGVRPGRVRTIYNGIDTRHFAPTSGPVAARTALGWDPDRPTVTMVAVPRPEKGHDVLLDAVPTLRARVPGVAVKLVGVDPGDPAVVGRIAAEGLADVVEAVGLHHDVRPMIEASDVVVLPSWMEALPTVLLEAGAMARPVVATCVGGVPEIVDDGRTGLLVEPGDAQGLAEALAQLLRDPGRAQRMGAAARSLVGERFSYPVQAAALRSLYDEVVAAR